MADLTSPEGHFEPDRKAPNKKLKLSNPEDQKRLLEIFKETGNIIASCRRIGVAPKTYYRYLKTNPEFKQRAQKALEVGQKKNKRSKLDDPQKQEELFQALEETGNIVESCRRVGLSPQTYYRQLETNPRLKQDVQRALEVGLKKNKRPKLDDPQKQKELLQALKETGNIAASCHRVGVAPKTYYSYLKADSEFAQKAEEARAASGQKTKKLDSPKVQNKLLKALEETGSVAESCRRVGVSTSTYYKYLKNSPEFQRTVEKVIQKGLITAPTALKVSKTTSQETPEVQEIAQTVIFESAKDLGARKSHLIDLSSRPTTEEPTVLSLCLEDSNGRRIVYKYDSQPATIAEDWSEEASCKFCGPSVFYTESIQSKKINIAGDFICQLCSQCPVSVDCFETALANETEVNADLFDSFWAALGFQQRLIIKQHRQNYAANPEKTPKEIRKEPKIGQRRKRRSNPIS